MGRWAILLVAGLVACSGVAPEYDSIEPEPPQPVKLEDTAAAVYPNAQGNYTSTKDVTCTPDCTPKFLPPLDASQKPIFPNCEGRTSKAACDSTNSGWMYGVPACGESGLWLHSCYWTGDKCTNGVHYTAWQTC